MLVELPVALAEGGCEEAVKSLNHLAR